jgi:hypothetical protein
MGGLRHLYLLQLLRMDGAVDCHGHANGSGQVLVNVLDVLLQNVFSPESGLAVRALNPEKVGKMQLTTSN